MNSTRKEDPHVELQVLVSGKTVWSGVVQTPVVLGRQSDGESLFGPQPAERTTYSPNLGTFKRIIRWLRQLATVRSSGERSLNIFVELEEQVSRFVIASQTATTVPRSALRVDQLASGLLRLKNIHHMQVYELHVDQPKTNLRLETDKHLMQDYGPSSRGRRFTAGEECTGAAFDVSLQGGYQISVRATGISFGDNRAGPCFNELNLDSGVSLGQYVIEKQLGRGGMGVVYLARHQLMNRQVAIKFPPPVVGRERLFKRFEKEVEISASLVHPNILQAYDAGIHQQTPYLVVECIHGSTVAELVRDAGPLSIADCIRYSIQAGLGLSYAHAKGIVHRDVKPANLMIDNSDTLRVIDFGLATNFDGLRTFSVDLLEQELPDEYSKIFREEFREAMHGTVMIVPPRSPSSTRNSELVGTPDFMSPEQTCAVEVDCRSDIYSLGCSIHYMLTASSLFPNREIHGKEVSVLQRHRKEVPVKLSAFRPDVSPELEKIVLRMLEKRPENRYSSMDEVVAHLREEQANLGFSDRIFLSYRRNDSFDATHRLFENLVQEFGEGSLVMDIDTIPAGEDFRAFIAESVRRSRVVLAIIGDHWLAMEDERTGRRLDSPDDYLRLELETAEAYRKPIIPILVGRAQMPAAETLPESLRFLSFRNAAEVRSGKRYQDDVMRLIWRLKELFSEA